jgi:hypothetical protein
MIPLTVAEQEARIPEVFMLDELFDVVLSYPPRRFGGAFGLGTFSNDLLR